MTVLRMGLAVPPRRVASVAGDVGPRGWLRNRVESVGEYTDTRGGNITNNAPHPRKESGHYRPGKKAVEKTAKSPFRRKSL